MPRLARKLLLLSSKPTFAVFIFALVLVASTAAGYFTNSKVAAATNSTINFQARLMNATGSIAPDGNYNIEFKLYNQQTSSGSSQGNCTGDSACLWTETYTGAHQISVANGYVNVSLGSLTSFPTTINWDQQLWLTMRVGGTGGTPSWDAEMSPRLQLTAVPYAFRAGQLAEQSGSNEATLQFAGTIGQNTTITLPDPGTTSATVCYQSSTACGFALSGTGSFIQNGVTIQTGANFAIRSNATGSVGGVIQGANGQTADLLDLQSWNGTTATTLFGVNNVGALTLNGTGTATFTTPGGSNVQTKIDIPVYDPGSFGQILILGLPSTASSTARAITVADARTVAHQPTIAVLSPDENSIFGLTWDGSNTTAAIKSSNSSIAITTAGGTDATFNDTSIGLLQNTSLAAGMNLTFGSGAGNFDQSASTGTFATGSGNNTLNGNTTVNGTKTFTVNGGLATLQGGLTVNGGAVQLNVSSNNNTSINTGSSTGAVSIGNAASGLLSLQGNASSTIVANNGTGKSTTLSFVAPTGADAIQFPDASGVVQLTPASGSYLQQVPSSSTVNTVTPTAANTVGLTVNATSGTSAVAAIFNQANNTSPADTIQINTTSTGTQTNGLLFTHNSSGTTTNGVNITNTAGTLSNGITLTATTAIANGINFTGSGGYTNLINASNFTVTNAGNISAAGTYNTNTFNSNTLQFGAGSTATVDSASGQALQIGTGANAHNITIGNTTGATTLTLQAGTGGIKVGSLATVDSSSSAVCRDNTGLLTTCDSGSGTRPFIQGGNSFGAQAVLGTNDANNLQVETNGIARATFDQSNDLYLGNGVTASSPNNFNLYATGSSTSGTGGAALAVQGGTGNGTGAGGQLTLQGGTGGGGAATAGGAVLIQGGTAAGTGVSNGGSITLQGGTASGTGTKGLIQLNGATYFTTGAFSNGSSVGITQSLIDSDSAILLTATASGLTFTVPSPSVSVSGRILYLTNAGTNALTLSYGSVNFTLNPGATSTLMWNAASSVWTSAGGDISTLQEAYSNSIGGTTPEILLDNTRNGVDIQDSNTTLGSTVPLLAVRASATATTLGSPLFTVEDSSGAPLVGIGTQTQTRALDVAVNNSSVSSPMLLLEQASASGDSALEFKNTGTASSFYVGQDTDSSNSFAISSSSAAASSPSTISYVQGNTSAPSGGATTVALAYSSNTTAGDLLVASAAWDLTNTSTASCSDSAGNAWSTAVLKLDPTSGGGNNDGLIVCYAPNVVGGADTVTVTFGATSSSRLMAIHEYSGAAKVNPVDVTASNTAAGTTATDGVTSTAAVTNQNGDLIFGTTYNDTASTTTITAGTGFTQRTLASTFMMNEDKTQSTAGSVAATDTYAAAKRYISAMVAFKATTSITDAFSSPLFTLSQSGATLHKNSVDSSSAFQIQSAASNVLFGVDTLGSNINVGATGTAALATTVNVGTSTGATQTINLGSNTSGSAANGTVILIQGGNTSAGNGAVSIQSLAAGQINIGSNNVANTIQIGDSTLSTGTQAINIGNGGTAGGTTNVTIGTDPAGNASTGTTKLLAKGDLTITGGTTSSWTLAGGNLNVGTGGSSATLTLQTGASGTINVGDTSGNTTTINIGGQTNNVRSINIGYTSATSNAQTIGIGAIGTGSTTSIQGGTTATALSLNTGTGGTISIGTSGVANTIQIGNTSGAVLQGISIGTNGTTSSTNNVTVGSTIAGLVTLQGSGITQKITSNTDTIQSSSNNANAFQVENSSASNNVVFGVDTSNNQAVLGTSGSIAGKLLFNSVGAGGVTLTTASTTTGYSLTLPTTGPTTGLCLETSSTTASQLVFSSCSNSNASITEVSESDNHGSSSTVNTVTDSPTNVGDLIVITAQIPSGNSITSISGGNVSSWTKVGALAGDGTINRVEMWMGAATATGAGTITISSAGLGNNDEITATEYTAVGVNAGTTWGADTEGGNKTTASATVTYPSLTPQVTGELYEGYAQVQRTPATAGSTSGFTYKITGQTNVITYNTNLTAATAYQPTANQASSGEANAISAVFTAFVSSTAIDNSTTVQQANFNVQAGTPGTVAAVLQAGTSGTSDILDAYGVGSVQNASDQVLSLSYQGNIQFGGLTAQTITVAAQQTANTAGASLTVTSATGNGTGTGGGLTLQAGTGGSTGSGGAVTIQGGSAGGGNTNGGNVLIEGGAAAGTGTGGSVIVKPQTDSANAFDVQNAAGTVNALNVNTSNIGGAFPSPVVTINSGTTGTSGLQFANLTNASSSSSTFSQLLGVDASGNVGLSSAGVSLTSPALAYWDGLNNPTTSSQSYPLASVSGTGTGAVGSCTGTWAPTFSSGNGEELNPACANTSGSMNWNFSQVPFEENQFQFKAGTGTADATWFYGYADSIPTTEYGCNVAVASCNGTTGPFITSGYIVYFSEFHGCIGISYGGYQDGNQCNNGGGTSLSGASPLKSVSASSLGITINDGNFHQVDVQILDNVITVRWDGRVILTETDSYGRDTSHLNYGFASRSGGSTNTHYIKGLLVTKLGTNVSEYNINNISPLTDNIRFLIPTPV